MDIIAAAKLKIDSVPGKAAQNIKKKIENVLSKNTGYDDLKNISNILKGESDITTNIDSSKIKYLKYAPIVSVETERSFSIYKNVFTENRTSFHFENLKEHIIVYCNQVLAHK